MTPHAFSKNAMSSPELSSSTPSLRRTLCIVFLAALAIRWAYILVMFAALGRDGLMIADSYGYLRMAEQFSADVAAGSMQGWQWLGRDLGVMPLFTWLLSLNVALAGAWAPLTYTLFQGLLDAGTCLLVYGMAEPIARRFALPAAIAAAINPTQVVLSGLVYTDTPFVFFVALFLFGALRWMRTPSWPQAVFIGVGLGGAALCRILVVPWAPVLIVFLLGAAYLRGNLRLVSLAQLAAAGAILCVSIAPIVLRNVTQYRAWALTPQSGVHLAQWIVPLVKEAQDGTPWENGAAQMAKRVKDRFGSTEAGPFESSRRHAEVGREALKELGVGAIAKAWIIGAAINLGAPAIVLSPPVSRLPRTGFFGTRGDSPLDKIVNFLFRSDNAAFAWLLVAGIAGAAAVRLLQLCGLVALVREERAWASVLLLALWCVYILTVNGPVASPKYRLPMEPALAILTGAGYLTLRNWIRLVSARSAPSA